MHEPARCARATGQAAGRAGARGPPGDGHAAVDGLRAELGAQQLDRDLLGVAAHGRGRGVPAAASAIIASSSSGGASSSGGSGGSGSPSSGAGRRAGAGRRRRRARRPLRRGRRAGSRGCGSRRGRCGVAVVAATRQRTPSTACRASAMTSVLRVLRQPAGQRLGPDRQHEHVAVDGADGRVDHQRAGAAAALLGRGEDLRPDPPDGRGVERGGCRPGRARGVRCRLRRRRAGRPGVAGSSAEQAHGRRRAPALVGGCRHDRGRSVDARRRSRLGRSGVGRCGHRGGCGRSAGVAGRRRAGARAAVGSGARWPRAIGLPRGARTGLRRRSHRPGRRWSAGSSGRRRLRSASPRPSRPRAGGSRRLPARRRARCRPAWSARTSAAPRADCVASGPGGGAAALAPCGTGAGAIDARRSIRSSRSSSAGSAVDAAGSSIRAHSSSSSSRGAVAPRISIRPACRISP